MNISSTTPIHASMNAANRRGDNIAHNVANVNTEGFRPQRIEQTEAAVRTDTAARTAQTGRTTDTYESTADTSTAAAMYTADSGRPDLARDMTDMNTLRNTYTANAEVVRAQSEVTETTIDLVG